jgi:hypothetical protein
MIYNSEISQNSKTSWRITTHGTFSFVHFLIIGKNFKLLQYIFENQHEVLMKELLKEVKVQDQKPKMIIEQDKWILGANCIHLAAKFMPRGLNLILTKDYGTTTNKNGLSPLHIAARNDESLSTR